MGEGLIRTIGVDLTDLGGRKAGLSTCAELRWNGEYGTVSRLAFPEDLGEAIRSWLGEGLVVAVDGPQGLAGHEGASMRLCERELATPGHLPVELPPAGAPYGGFVRGSVALFAGLVRSGGVRLLGLDEGAREANLLEVFPGAGFRLLRERDRCPKPIGLTKHNPRVRLLHKHVLERRGLRLGRELPSDDLLDAAMAAYTALCFELGRAVVSGEAPWWDLRAGLVREGYIVQPTAGRLTSRPSARPAASRPG